MASLVDTRPATTAGAVASVPAAILAVVVGAGWWSPSPGELAAVIGALASIEAILAKFVASVVYCRQTVTGLLGPPAVTPPPVAPETPAVVPVAPSPQAVADTPLGATPEMLEEYMRRQAEAPPPPPPPPPPQ